MMTDIASVLLQAASLMGIGMIAVFAFLSLLILVVNLLAKVAPPIQEESAPAPSATQQANQVADASVIAAITAAVQQYRKAHQ